MDDRCFCSKTNTPHWESEGCPVWRGKTDKKDKPDGVLTDLPYLSCGLEEREFWFSGKTILIKGPPAILDQITIIKLTPDSVPGPVKGAAEELSEKGICDQSNSPSPTRHGTRRITCLHRHYWDNCSNWRNIAECGHFDKRPGICWCKKIPECDCPEGPEGHWDICVSKGHLTDCDSFGTRTVFCNCRDSVDSSMYNELPVRGLNDLDALISGLEESDAEIRGRVEAALYRRCVK